MKLIPWFGSWILEDQEFIETDFTINAASAYDRI